jgi:geranylgeranyl diphosphate synthase type I
MAGYHMGWLNADGTASKSGNGKRLRPALCLWASEACGRSPTEALPAALCIEWIHNFTLIHDDIQDSSRQRRHRETVWSRWGAAQGINAGDALYALAIQSLLGAAPASTCQVRAGRVITRALLEVIDGQCLDLSMEGKPHTSPSRYMRLIRAKTGALVGASLESGAVMSRASAGMAAAFRGAGRLLGLAFQLRDDWLGVWGDPEVTGKPQDGDLARRKLSHPVVAAYAVASAEQRSERRRLYRKVEPGGENRIREILLELDGPELTAGAARDMALAAVARLRTAGLARQRIEEFEEVAVYVADRTG